MIVDDIQPHLEVIMPIGTFAPFPGEAVREHPSEALATLQEEHLANKGSTQLQT